MLFRSPPLRAEGPAGPPEELTRPAAKAPAPAAKSPAPPGTTAPAVATPAARPPAPVVVPTQGQALLLWAAPLEPLPTELARAAEGFGKGRDVGDFRPRGALEIRQAAHARGATSRP